MPGDIRPRRGWHQRWTISNYAACYHDVESPIDVNNNGVMYLNSHISQKDVTDGTRTRSTWARSWATTQDLGWMSGTRATLRNTGAARLRLSLVKPRGGMPQPPDNDLTVGGFESGHAGLSNFLFGDGRTTAIADIVDAKVFQQLGNRADGQLLESGPTRDE